MNKISPSLPRSILSLEDNTPFVAYTRTSGHVGVTEVEVGREPMKSLRFLNVTYDPSSVRPTDRPSTSHCHRTIWNNCGAASEVDRR
eukprot:scaffold354170_cov71-Attheya_sp.AAC.1